MFRKQEDNSCYEREIGMLWRWFDPQSASTHIFYREYMKSRQDSESPLEAVRKKAYECIAKESNGGNAPIGYEMTWLRVADVADTVQKTNELIGYVEGKG